MRAVLGFMKDYSMVTNAFRCYDVDNGDSRTVTLVHDLGFKASSFLSEFFDAIFRNIGMSPNVSMLENSVVISLRVAGGGR